MKLVVRYIAYCLIVVISVWCLLTISHALTRIYFNHDSWHYQTKLQRLGRGPLFGRHQEGHDWKRAEKMGNYLIDKYGLNDDRLAGENGRGILLASTEEKEIGDEALNSYHVNTKISDMIPLNRKVPDSRPLQCPGQLFEESTLPKAAVVITFHNEWPSILLRTIYSLINRTPRRLLKEIILVDDASTLKSLKEPLDKYIDTHFPRNLIKMVRLNERSGLINARLKGFDLVTAEVTCIFDSHMEVNIDWLQPLLVEIKKNRSTVAMSQLDYIQATSLLYHFDRDYKHRYGFDWLLRVFEDFFRDDQIYSKELTDAFPGVVMIGSGFAVNTEYFKEIGTYDSGMKIWGGENLELSWRVSMCGGQLVHVLCSHIGHIARAQPYQFPNGRIETEVYNYKRAVDVWLGPYKKYVYNAYPAMKVIDTGNITDRLMLKKRLKCKSFDWYLDNIWPELSRFEMNVKVSGQFLNVKRKLCLDNGNYVYQEPSTFIARKCNGIIAEQMFFGAFFDHPQGPYDNGDSLGSEAPHLLNFYFKGFSLTEDKLFRTSLNCVGTQCGPQRCVAVLTNCQSRNLDRWEHAKDGHLQSDKNLCLDLDEEENLLVGSPCAVFKASQKWIFLPIPT